MLVQPNRLALLHTFEVTLDTTRDLARRVDTARVDRTGAVGARGAGRPA